MVDKTENKNMEVWIQNCLNKIRHFLPINSCRFIRTNGNPADTGTCHTKPDTLLDKTLRWKGPSLLNSLQYSFDSYWVCCERKDADSFVDCETSSWKPGDETDVEEKRFVVTMKGTAEFVSGTGAIINVESFSCLKRMFRVMTYVLRFCSKFFK